MPIDSRLRLPSLEWLEAMNSRSLGAATLLVALGFFTGVVARLANRGSAGVPWNDPVAWSLGAMLLWLSAAELFRVVYPAARRGRKVAYLTLAAFVFLLVTLASFTLDSTFHQGDQFQQTPPPAALSHFLFDGPAAKRTCGSRYEPSILARGGRLWTSA
jgi:hypothetical protein